MKKQITMVLLAVLLAGVLDGCGSGKSDTAEYLKDIKADRYVTLGAYKGIEVSAPLPEVTEEDIDATIEYYLMSFPMSEAVDGPTQAGDYVNIDFVGYLDGVAFDKGAAAGYDYTIGSYQFIADLDDGMVGMSVGDVWDIPVRFPDEYQSEDLAGQDAVFNVTMNSIERAVVDQTLTDEYVIWLTAELEEPFSDVAAFRAFIAENIELEAQSRYENEIANLIAEQIIENAEFKSLPAALLARINSSLTANLTYYAQMYGMDLDTYLLLSGMVGADDEVADVIAVQAERSAQRYIAYQAIADVEGLNVSNAEVEDSITEMAEAAGVSVAEYKMGLDYEGYREYLMLERVTAFLNEQAIILP